MQCGSLKGAFLHSLLRKKKLNKGKTEVSAGLRGDVSYGISHWSSSTALRKPALLRPGFPTGVGERKGLGGWKQRRHLSRSLCRHCCALLTQSPLLQPGQGETEVKTWHFCLVWDRQKHFIPGALFVINLLL